MDAHHKLFQMKRLYEVIDGAKLEDLKLRPPSKGDKFSPDLQPASLRKSPVGVQGIILDAMDNEDISFLQAHTLLCHLQRRLAGGSDGFSVVKDGGFVLDPISPVG